MPPTSICPLTLLGETFLALDFYDILEAALETFEALEVADILCFMKAFAAIGVFMGSSSI